MKYIKFSLFFSFVLVLFFFSASQSQAATYYVDSTNGNNANDGKSTANAWKTIDKANINLVAGDTVYIMNGTYSERIFPSHSGSAGNPITYKNYPGHSPILKGTDQGYGVIRFSVGKNYFIVDGITVNGEPRDNSLPQWWFVWNEGDHNTIQNCILTNGTANVDGGVRIYGNYNKLLNCTISHAGARNIGDVWIEGSYNLVEGCTIADIGHDCINNMGHHNIIRNNDLYNPIYRVADAAHSLGSDARSYLVFDGNRVYGASIHGMQANSPYSIIRRNIVYDNAQHGLGIYGGQPGMGSASHARIYQNTFYNNGGVAIKLNKNGTDSVDIVLKNNLSYKNVGGFTWYENVDPANQHEINNFNGNPLFKDETNKDFNLQSNSQCINTGAWLTTTTSAGSGTNIPVTDAGYFIDGFGIVQGDTIQLQGQTNTARITSINYDTNTLTVNASLTWSSGQGVAMAYSGSAPDIGAFEYISSAPASYCGDGTCNGTETCSSCASDCGVCPDTASPSMPTNLTAMIISSSQINLSWSASTDNIGVTGYRIYRGGTQIATSTTTGYSNTGLSASTTYVYTVAAYDAAGNASNQSPPASATTQSPADTTPPVISSVLSGSVTYNSARITWTTNENSNSQVEYGLTTNYGNSTILNTSMVLSHSVSLSGLNVSAVYHYRVKSRDAAGNLSVSLDNTFTTLAVPSSVLTASLQANPSSGNAPLSGIDLTATVLGEVAGTINYTFYCDRSDAGTNITSRYNAKYDGVSQTTMTATDVCSYKNSGNHVAKVIIERGAYQAESRFTITLSKRGFLHTMIERLIQVPWSKAMLFLKKIF